MATDYPWNQSPPQQGFSLPVSLGPMVLPAEPPKRRWRGTLAWSLCLFAGGVAAGPLLIDYAYQGVDAGARVLEKRAPKLLGRYRPSPPEAAPANRLAEGPSLARTAPAAPPRGPEVREVQVVQIAAVEAAPERAVPTPSEGRGGRGKHGKTAPKVVAPEPAPAPVLAAASRKPGRHDPFEDGAGAEPTAKREPKPAAEPAPAKPAPKAKSADSLDSLMADVPTDSASKNKGKRSASKDIDAMLKDVQKSEPAPAPKRVEKAELPQLTPADISRVMAGVKTRANACGKRLGQKGIADVKLTVGKDGRVSDASVGGKVAGTPLADCVDKAVRAAAFPPNAGLKFDYRIDVH